MAFRRHLTLGHGHGRNFVLREEGPVITLPLGKNEDAQHIVDPRLANVMRTGILTYSVPVEGRLQLRVAVHEHDDELNVWEVPSLNNHLTGTGMVVPEYRHDGQYVLYSTDRHLRVSMTKNLVAWHTVDQLLISPRPGWFDRNDLKLVNVASIDRGIFVLYESSHVAKDQVTVSLGGALFAADNPSRLLWRSDDPLWEETSPVRDEKRILGAVVEARDFTLYLTSRTEQLITITLPKPFAEKIPRSSGTKLHRHPKNPILSPTTYEWESEAVFNPAAFIHDNRVHLLYRAIGPDGVSRIGYASSADGIHFDERLDHPVYTPTYGIGMPDPANATGARTYNRELNPSGGGWAGCEDPRVIVIEDRAYMSFVAFDGWNFIRQALTSIPLTGIVEKRWDWKKPVLISRPGETHKNWVIFPEKINGKYAILHGVSPKIHIEYIDSLDELDGQTYIQSLPSHGGAGYHDASRQDHWDNRVRGAGAPPLKTPMGWLLLYHATDRRDPGKYKLGAMLLDLADPTKVLHRSDYPLLEPDEWYENDGKPGVVYTCGAVIVGENLIVYYGGGDKRIAVARTNVMTFLKALAEGTATELKPVDLTDQHEMSVH